MTKRNREILELIKKTGPKESGWVEVRQIARIPTAHYDANHCFNDFKAVSSLSVKLRELIRKGLHYCPNCLRCYQIAAI
jgi:hypothetical protein